MSIFPQGKDVDYFSKHVPLSRMVPEILSTLLTTVVSVIGMATVLGYLASLGENASSRVQHVLVCCPFRVCLVMSIHVYR